MQFILLRVYLILTRETRTAFLPQDMTLVYDYCSTNKWYWLYCRNYYTIIVSPINDTGLLYYWYYYTIIVSPINDTGLLYCWDYYTIIVSPINDTGLLYCWD